MCRMCDGATEDEVLAELDSYVVQYGFAQVPVENDGQPWTYTIGLAARGHPELVLAGTTLEPATQVVDRLARRVLEGERFDSDASVTEGGQRFTVRAVHAWHFDQGLMAIWNNYYLGRPDPPPFAALQVVAPATWFCRCHANSQPRLDLPHPFPSPPNREARRRMARRRGRPRPRDPGITASDG
jgi:hypothetical protein